MMSRDYLLVRRTIVDRDRNRIAIITRSTKHNECPPKEKLVRVEEYESAMLLYPHTRIDKVGFDFRLTSVDNPKTNLPRPVTNYAVTTGGHEVPGEDYPIDTALRETREETGLLTSKDAVFGCIGPIPNRRGERNIAAVLADIGEVEKENLVLNTSEVTEVFFLSFQSILDEKNQRYTLFRNFRYFGMPVYLGGPLRVWGITGTIIDLVLELILPPEIEYQPIRTRNWKT